jgi:hypothetical protein
MSFELVLLCVAAASSTVALVLAIVPPEQHPPRWALDLHGFMERFAKRLDVLEARISVPKLDEPARRRELAERAVAYADQLGGPRAQRLAHALAAMRLLAPPGAAVPPDNIARIEIEAVLARRKPAPAPGTGEKRVAP